MTTNSVENKIKNPRIKQQSSDHSEWQDELDDDGSYSFDGAPLEKCVFFEDLSRFVEWEDEVSREEAEKENKEDED